MHSLSASDPAAHNKQRVADARERQAPHAARPRLRTRYRPGAEGAKANTMNDEPPPMLPGVGALDALAAAAAAHAPPKRARSNVGLNAVAEAAAAAAAADQNRAEKLRTPLPLALGRSDIMQTAQSHQQHAATLASISEWAPPSQAPLPPMQAPPAMGYDAHHGRLWPQTLYAHHVDQHEPLPHISAARDAPRGHQTLTPLAWQPQQPFVYSHVIPPLSAHHQAESGHSSGLRHSPLVPAGPHAQEPDHFMSRSAAFKLPPVIARPEAPRRASERDEVDARQRLSSSSQLSQEPLKPLPSAELDVIAHERMESPSRVSKPEPGFNNGDEHRHRGGACSPLPPMLISPPEPESALSAVASVAAAAAPLPSNTSTTLGLPSAPLDALADVALHAMVATPIRTTASRDDLEDLGSGKSEDQRMLEPLRLPSPDACTEETASRQKQADPVAESEPTWREPRPTARHEQEVKHDAFQIRPEKSKARGEPSRPKNPPSKASDGKKKRKSGKDETDASVDGDEITRCPCGSTENSQYMVACDECKTWQHFKCMGLRRRGDVAPDKKYYCHICRPHEMRSNCIAHPRYKEKAQSRDRDRIKDLDPALSGVKPLELRRLFSADLKAHRLSAEGFLYDELFRRYAGLFRNQFGKDKQSVIEGLTVVTEFARIDVQSRLESVLLRMRGGTSRINSAGVNENIGVVGASADVAGVSDASPVSRPVASPASRVSPMSLRDDGADVGRLARASGEALSPRKDVSMTGSDAHAEQQGKGKRSTAKAGSKRPRSTSVLNAAAPEERHGGAGDEALAGGDTDDMAANGRSMSREDKKLFHIMRMFKKLEEQERGKKKPRTASAHDSPKQCNGDNQGGHPSPVHGSGDLKASGDTDAVADKILLDPAAGAGESGGHRPTNAGLDVGGNASPKFNDVQKQVDPEASDGRALSPGVHEDNPTSESMADVREVPVINPVPSRDKPRADDRDRSAGEHKKSAKAIDVPKIGLVAASSRDRKGRRVSDSAITPRPVRSALVSARRSSGKGSAPSTSARPTEECQPIDPVLLIRVHVPGPSVLRSQLVPVTRRSRLENEAAEEEVREELSHVPPRSLKKEWLRTAAMEATTQIDAGALPSKKRWVKEEDVQRSQANTESVQEQETEKNTPVSSTAAQSALNLDLEPDGVCVSMVVVSERDSLPDQGKKLEVSLVQGKASAAQPAPHLAKHDDENVLGTGGVGSGPGRFDDAIRCVIVKSRTGAKANCLKKRVAMFCTESGPAAKTSAPSPGTPNARVHRAGGEPRQPSVSSPILSLRSAPLPPRSPEMPLAFSARKQPSSLGHSGEPSSATVASGGLRENSNSSSGARMPSPLLKKRCTAFLKSGEKGSTLAGSKSAESALDGKDGKLGSASKSESQAASPHPEQSPSPLRSRVLQSSPPAGSPQSSSGSQVVPKSAPPLDVKASGARIPRVGIPRSAPAVSLPKAVASVAGASQHDAKNDLDALPVSMNSVPLVPRFRVSPLSSPTASGKAGSVGMRSLTSTPPPPASSQGKPTSSPNWRPAYRFGNGGGRGNHHVNGSVRNSYPPAKLVGFGSKRNPPVTPSPGNGRLSDSPVDCAGVKSFSGKGAIAASKPGNSGEASPTPSAAAALSAWSSFRQQNGWSQNGGGNIDPNAANPTGSGGASSNSKRRQRG